MKKRAKRARMPSRASKTAPRRKVRANGADPAAAVQQTPVVLTRRMPQHAPLPWRKVAGQLHGPVVDDVIQAADGRILCYLESFHSGRFSTNADAENIHAHDVMTAAPILLANLRLLAGTALKFLKIVESTTDDKATPDELEQYETVRVRLADYARVALELANSLPVAAAPVVAPSVGRVMAGFVTEDDIAKARAADVARAMERDE